MNGLNGKKGRIVIPVVGFAREFDGKLLLALVSRERGHRTFLGSKPALNKKTAQLSPMLYVAKSAYTDSVDLFAELRHAGNKIAVLDEEALVRQSDEIYLMKHHQDALENVELLMSWGQSDQHLWHSSSLKRMAPAIAVGNPRVDMLRPLLKGYFESEVASIASRFGDYVLINTNFPTVNNYLTRGESFALAAKTERAADEKKKFLAYKRRVFERFKDMVPALAKAIFPRNLVIRPHPSEMHEPWLEAAKGLTNVHIVFEGSVVPWLMGAGALVHNGCTSGIEYALLGRMALSYRSETPEDYEDSLANKLSLSCFTKETLLEALTERRLQLSEEQQKLLKQHIEIQDSRLCCEAMIDAIENGHLPEKAPGLDLAGLWSAGMARIHAFFQPSRKKREGKTDYRRHMFPSITTDYVDERILRFQRCLGRFQGMRSKRIAARAFEIV